MPERGCGVVVSCRVVNCPLNHRSPVADCRRRRPTRGRCAAPRVRRTVRLPRRFTSPAGYWVQLFTLGSVTGRPRRLLCRTQLAAVSRASVVAAAAAFDATAIDFSL